jgi:hypothetical protein
MERRLKAGVKCFAEPDDAPNERHASLIAIRLFCVPLIGDPSKASNHNFTLFEFPVMTFFHFS